MGNARLPFSIKDFSFSYVPHLYQKIVDEHTIKRIDAQTVLLTATCILPTNTPRRSFAGLSSRKLPAAVPDAHLCVVDHIIPSTDESPRRITDHDSFVQAQTLEANCRKFGIRAFYGPNDPNQASNML